MRDVILAGAREVQQRTVIQHSLIEWTITEAEDGPTIFYADRSVILIFELDDYRVHIFCEGRYVCGEIVDIRTHGPRMCVLVNVDTESDYEYDETEVWFDPDLISSEESEEDDLEDDDWGDDWDDEDDIPTDASHALLLRLHELTTPYPTAQDCIKALMMQIN